MKKLTTNKINFIMLALFLTMHSFINSTSDEHQTTRKHKTAKAANIIQFKVHDDFGGAQARGKYNHKKKTAIIIYANEKYSFTGIVEDRSPSTPDKKNISSQLQLIGEFTNKLSKEMPITIYLFGQLIKKEPNNESEQNKVQSEQKE